MIDELNPTIPGTPVDSPTTPDVSAPSSPSPGISRRPKPRGRKQWATADIARALERRYPQEKSAYAILYEVGNGTGMGCNRHCDAIVMSLWPSRGIHLSGFEFKASRSDWMKELADPAKADSIQRYCDYWWLAVADKDIVKEGELPEKWGLVYLDSRGSLTTAKPAPKLKPVPMDREMLAAIMRRAAEPVANMAEREIRQARDAGRREGREYVEKQLKQSQESLLELRQKIHEFERASGIDLGMAEYSWRPESPQRIGEAVRSILSGELLSGSKHLEIVLQTIRLAADELANVLEVAKAGSENIQFHLKDGGDDSSEVGDPSGDSASGKTEGA